MIKVEDVSVSFAFPDKRRLAKNQRRVRCSLKIGENVIRTTAKTNLVEDKFEKNVGAKVALTKALSVSQLDKNVRTEIWRQFFQVYPRVVLTKKFISAIG